MRQVLMLVLLCLSLVALAQAAPNAILLRIDQNETQLIGALEGKTWVQPKNFSGATIQQVKTGFKTQLFNLKGMVGNAVMGGKFELGQCDWNRLTSGSIPAKLEFPTYAIAATWNAVPRAIKVLKTTNDTLLATVKSELKQYRDIKPARISQIVQADLDNDTHPEVIIVAQSVDNVYQINEEGNYSLVLVRKIIAGKVQTFRLRGNYFTQGNDPTTDIQRDVTNHISAIADVDGNGSMDIVVDTEIYQGNGTAIFSWTGNGFSRILIWGCGV